jgi:DNA polymerase-3 subunit beta
LGTEGKKLTLMTTEPSKEIVMKSFLPAEVLEEGSVLLPGKLFEKCLKVLDDKIEICTKEKVVGLTSGECKIELVEARNFIYPSTTVTIKEGISVKISQKVLKKLTKNTVFAAAIGHWREAINGILLTIEGKEITFVGTDGHRLAIQKKPIPGFSGIGERGIIPVGALKILKLLKKTKAPVKITLNEKMILFEWNGNFLKSNLISSEEYPNYKQAIPKDFQRKIVVPRKELLRAVKRAEISGATLPWTRKGKLVTFLLSQGKFFIEAKNLKEEIKVINWQGESGDLKIKLDSRYLKEGIKPILSKNISVELSAPNSPVAIKPVGKEKEDYFYLLGPIY